MKKRKSAIATASLIAVFAAGLFPVTAAADDSGEVQDLKREVSQLRAQMQALQAAVMEATELERQRAVALARLNKEPSQPAATPAAAPVANNEAPSGAREISPAPVASAGRDDKGSSKSRRRHHRRSERSRSKSR
jgi:hypothetical protein